MPSVSRNGVVLAYDRTGGAGQPLVFVHGWCCDRSYFAPQVEHFAGRGHAVLALDLRGHGESDGPGGAYTMRTFADDAAWLCRDLGIVKPVVIGHSMGGVVAFDLAVRHLDLPAALVMIDSPVVRTEASRALMPAFFERLRSPDYAAALQDYVARALFLPTDDAERKARILAAMARTPQHVMLSAFEGMRDYDPKEAAGHLLPPCLYIAADDGPLSDMQRFFSLVPTLLFGQTVGSGHFCQLEVPDQVNAMLARFLAILPALREAETASRAEVS